MTQKRKTITIDGLPEIELRPSKRARRVRLAVSSDHKFYVVKPSYVSVADVTTFIASNKGWLKKQIEKLPPKLSFHDGQKISQHKTLKVVKSDNAHGEKITETPERVTIRLERNEKLDDDHTTKALVEYLIKIWRSEAKKYLPYELKRLSDDTGLKYNDLRLKYLHSRWGSCSTRNNINLNIQLMRLDKKLIRHVLLHELVHTREHNHSQKFWEIFESFEADAWKTAKILRSHQLF